LPKDEPVPPEGDVECPPEINGRAREFWDRRAPVLAQMGLLTVADESMLAMLCRTEAELWDAWDDVAKNGMRLLTYTEAGERHLENPAVKMASDAQKRLKALEVEFGMSPSSRTRVKAQPKPVEKTALEKLRDRRNA